MSRVPASPSGPGASLDAILADLHGAAEGIWASCSASWPGLNVDVVEELGSTNTELMERGRKGQTWPTVLVAARQTAGRGRRGRDWLARPGDALTFSVGLALPFDTTPGGAGALSLAVGLSLAQAIDRGLQARHVRNEGPAMPPLGLKWPNDLWLGGRKLGGVLIEATPAPGLSEGSRWVVVGVGLNIHPGDAPPGSSWLDASQPPRLHAGEVWHWVTPALLEAMRAFIHAGFAPLQAAWRDRDVLQGRTVQLWTRPGQAPGTGHEPDQIGLAQGVDEGGALLVHTDEGLRRWSSGEVSVRLPA